jgi:tetratricopeptide (TPR) repeat protein
MEASISAIASDEDAKCAGVEASSPSVLRWMSRRNDNWLMIFDGADVGYEIVEAFIPAGKHGNILISSRNATLDRLASSSSAYMEVVEFDKDAAVELFIKSARLGSLSPGEQRHSELIVSELCCLALAVDQAASSIKTGICRIDDYLDLYKRRRLQLMDDPFFKGSSNYGRAVYTTWDISIAELEHKASSSASDSASYATAILLLRIFSFFHFDGIREEIFRRAAEATDDWWSSFELDRNSPLSYLLARLESDTWDSFHFHVAIRILTQFSLIHSDGGTIYYMHRLVHQWMQDRLPTSSHNEIALLAAIVLARSENNGGSADDYAHRRALLIHLITLSSHLKDAGLMNQLSIDTMKRMAKVWREAGRPAEAEVLLRQAISLIRKDTLEATEQSIDTLSELAFVLWKLGRLREAEDLQRQVLEWREKHLGTDRLLTAGARYNLATTLHDLGALQEAKELKIRVLDGWKEHLGMDNPDTYQAMANLAMTFRKLGEFVEAKELEIQVLDWRKEHLGMDHPDTYVAMANLAATFHHLGGFVEAKELGIQVLDWRKEHLGMDHPDTYLAMANLAATLCKLGEFVEAKELEIRVLDWRKEYLGMDHPDTYVAMANLAATFRELGEFVEAKELEIRVLDWQKEHLGMDHPDTYVAMANLAVTHYELDELSEARGLEEQVLDWRQVQLGPTHSLTRLTMNNLAYTLKKLGQVSEAEELFAQVKELRGATEHPRPACHSTN